jgi:predicted Zn finger-like uncharacterized protein
MRIVCENCAAAYSIAEKIIGPSGRIVKCAKCSHSWKVVPNKSPENENSKSGGSLAPVINTKLRFLVSFLILILK